MMRSQAIVSGRAPASDAAARKFFDLGMTCATGAGDLVSAHKWFNLAAMRGNREATRLRCEIAAEMTTQEITTAQRAARAWITTH